MGVLASCLKMSLRSKLLKMKNVAFEMAEPRYKLIEAGSGK